LNPSNRKKRPEDAKLVETVLNKLWEAGAGASISNAVDLVVHLEKMPEFAWDEEPEGIEMFGQNALAVLDFALRSYIDDSMRYLLLCARRAFDAAWFLEARLHADEESTDPLADPLPRPWENPAPQDRSMHFHTRELDHQRSDLAIISGVGPSGWETALMTMRESSDAYSIGFSEALRRYYWGHDGA